MAYGDFKYLSRKTIISDKILCHKAFNIAKNLKFDEYSCLHAWMIYKFFDKKTTGEVVKIVSNKKLAKELQKLKI